MLNSFKMKIAGIVLGIGIVFAVINGAMFQAEKNMMYHVVDIFGNESLVKEPGPAYLGWGPEPDPWKTEVSVVFSSDTTIKATKVMGPVAITFLDQELAMAGASVRVAMPTDNVNFFAASKAYRNQANLINQSILPTMLATVKATGQSMTAGTYFSGGSTSFSSYFTEQMNTGIKEVLRVEAQVEDTSAVRKCQALNTDDNKLSCADMTKTVFEVKPVLGNDGLQKVLVPSFLKYGITISDAIITNVQPGEDFEKRMSEKRASAALLAENREKRITEEETELLVVARGKTEVARINAIQLANQTEVIMAAQTQKALSKVMAEELEAKAVIDQRTAQLEADTAIISAEAIVVTAKAQAKARDMLLKADDGFAQRIELEKHKYTVLADAIKNARVPTNMIVSGGDNKGTHDPMSTLMNIKALQMMNDSADKGLKVKPIK